MPNSIRVENFTQGLVDRIEAKSIPRGAASAVSGFLTKLDHIELVRGRLRMGTEVTGNGIVTGLFVGRTADGTEVLYRRRSTKLEYYDTATEDWIESSNGFTDGEYTNFANYSSLAGSQMWIGNRVDGLFKIMTANPADVIDQYNSSKNYKGFINIKDSRMHLWDRVADRTGFYMSYIDDAQYTTVAAEVLDTGDGSTKAFSGTLAFKAGGAVRSCFGIVVTDGTETFTDDYSGTLTGSAGGTGTINYATGEIAVTFNANVTNLQDITVDYQWEDSTNNGIADFTESGTRLAGEGATFRQDHGGDPIMATAILGDDIYSLKEKSTFKLSLTADDTNATNNVYRERAGIPSIGMYAETEDGIYFVDNSTKNVPKLRILRTGDNNNVVQPVSVSDKIDITGYAFDVGDMVAWGDYIVFSGRTTDVDYANTTFVYDRMQKSFDILPWAINKFAIYNGALHGGESISHNVYELFSGVDDDEFGYDASWESHEDFLDTPRLKVLKRFRVQGKIGVDQNIYVDLKFDNDNWQEIGVVEGNGIYVDAGQSVAVGAVTVGKNEVGGGSEGLEAYNYETQFVVNSDKFEKVKVRFRIDGDLGWAEVSMYEFFGIKIKRQKLPQKYRSN